MSQAEYVRECKRQAEAAYDYLGREFGIKKIEHDSRNQFSKNRSFVFTCPTVSKKIIIK